MTNKRLVAGLPCTGWEMGDWAVCTVCQRERHAVLPAWQGRAQGGGGYHMSSKQHSLWPMFLVDSLAYGLQLLGSSIALTCKTKLTNQSHC